MISIYDIDYAIATLPLLESGNYSHHSLPLNLCNCCPNLKNKYSMKIPSLPKKQIKKQYGDKPLENKDYGKIINERHFERLSSLIDKSKVIIGGETNSKTNQIAPTVMDNVTESDAVMGEEIFGPIMPILTFDNFDKLVDDLKDKDKPLALYLFSSNMKHISQLILQQISQI